MDSLKLVVVVDTYTGYASRPATLEARGGLDAQGVVVFVDGVDPRWRRASPTRGTSFEGSASSSEDYGGLRTKKGATDNIVSARSTRHRSTNQPTATDEQIGKQVRSFQQLLTKKAKMAIEGGRTVGVKQLL